MHRHERMGKTLARVYFLVGDVLAFGTIAFEHGPHDLLREEGMYCIEYPTWPLTLQGHFS